MRRSTYMPSSRAAVGVVPQAPNAFPGHLASKSQKAQSMAAGRARLHGALQTNTVQRAALETGANRFDLGESAFLRFINGDSAALHPNRAPRPARSRRQQSWSSVRLPRDIVKIRAAARFLRRLSGVASDPASPGRQRGHRPRALWDRQPAVLFLGGRVPIPPRPPHPTVWTY